MLVFRSCSTWCIQQKKMTQPEHKTENALKRSVVFSQVKKRTGSLLTFRFQRKKILNKHSVHVDLPLQKEKLIFL